MHVINSLKMVGAGLLLVSASGAQPAHPRIATVPVGTDEATAVALAARVAPSPRQLAWQELEFAAFAHFGMNTFTDREWGEGTEDPALFNPTEFDARQWVQACKDAGMTLLILTAKHHDGFCLWPSAHTEHSVKNSPWRGGKGDVVREVADACREGGIKFGVYLSPWDRHEKTYGDSPAYNAYYMNQLRELLTNYGPIADVWMDGACGEGPNGKKQEYDWKGYFSVVRELQPAATLSICGPDVRWCGNEAGECRESEWSVLPTFIGTPPPNPAEIDLIPIPCNAMEKDLGSRSVLRDAAARGACFVWYPSQVDTSIRPGWFYHAKEDEKVKSLSHLLDIYYGSVGGNSQLLLNIPPDRRGRIHENDVARLRELGQVLRATFAKNLAMDSRTTSSSADVEHPAANTLDGDKATCWMPAEETGEHVLEFELPAMRTFNRAMLQEHTPTGQRIEEFFLEAWNGQAWKTITRATTVGYKRLLRFDAASAERVRLRITQSRLSPTISEFGLYYEPPVLAAPAIRREANGRIAMSAQPGCEIRYWLDEGKRSDSSSRKYEKPFVAPAGGIIKALAIPPDGDPCLNLGGNIVGSFEIGPPPAKTGDRAPKKTGWKNFDPKWSEAAVKRTNDDFPLSDQENTAGWRKYEPFWDEFDGRELDTAKWWPHNPTWKGRQPGYFAPENVSVRDGQLHLVAQMQEPPEALKAEGYHTFTTAAVQSRDRVRYGYFEVKARAMASGASSAFWFYDAQPDWWTEIDVFEIGGRARGFERKYHMTVHVMKTPVTKEHFQVGDFWSAPFDLADGYHVYGLEWDERELKFYVDGLLVRSGPNTDWRQPLTLNFDSETMPEWFGLPDPTDLPSTFSIEYVRAWKKSPRP